MKLASLLEQHKKSSDQAGALKDSFGDGFLIANNSIYRSVRKQALAAGFRFSTAQSDAYRVLPLSQLDVILKTKIVPYFDNVSVLFQLEAKMPRETAWDDISDNLKGNSVFHEACHAVARSLAPDLALKLVTETNADSLHARVLAGLLEESFANTCELLSITDAGDQVHRIFLELNSYVYMLDNRVHLVNAGQMFGREAFFKFVMLCYLHSNFLRDLSDKSFERCVALACEGSAVALKAAKDPKLRKSLRQISKIAFQLNPRFREVTTRFYLRLNGIRIEVSDLHDFDFLAVVGAAPSAQKFLSDSGAGVRG